MVIVLVITIAYSLSNDESNDVSTESPATPWTNKTIRPSRALNESEIYGLLLFATWPITGNRYLLENCKKKKVKLIICKR